MPDAASPGIVVGRSLSTYTVDGVQNDSLTVTYTVYNETPNDASGVLLTTTLDPGISVASSSLVPDTNGQQLAWSLGTIAGYGRSSVTVNLGLPNATPLQIDTGAQAFASQNVSTLTDTTAPAALVNRTIPSDELAATPDADSDDPFIQEEAAALDYDPNQIFQFLKNDIGYDSYQGSLRGARGTLWSNAGNALDIASLGVALFRASGIPAQYAQGTLPDPQAQQLILSMFPNQDRVVGSLPAGADTADPANDPQLLAETRAHYWIQVDTGGGFENLDSTIAGSQIGQSFAPLASTFTEIADSLRIKVDVQLNAEMYTQAAAELGVSNGLRTTMVLNQEFNAADLVGRPVTVADFVTVGGSAAPSFTERTYTYTPYLVLGDEAFAPSDSQLISGTSYQEVLTNFPLANQLLTGLFLDVTISGPGQTTQTYEHAIVDRIGFAVRHGAAGSVTVNPNGPPAISDEDAYTLNITSSAPNPGIWQPQEAEMTQEMADVQNLPSSGTLTDDQNQTLRQADQDATRLFGDMFQRLSSVQTQGFADSMLVHSYFDSPRIVLTSVQVVSNSDGTNAQLEYAIDLMKNTMRSMAPPGQTPAAPVAFNLERGLGDNSLEAELFTITSPPQVQPQGSLSSLAVFNAANAQGIGLSLLSQNDIGAVSTLGISADAQARITDALNSGLLVMVPDQMVQLNGAPAIAWLEIDGNTGETTGVTADGGHEGLAEFAAEQVLEVYEETASDLARGGLVGFFIGNILSLQYRVCTLTNPVAQEAALLLKHSKEGVDEFCEELENAVKTAKDPTPNPPIANPIPSFQKLIGLPDFGEAVKTIVISTTKALTGIDPPVSPILINPAPPAAGAAYITQIDLPVAVGPAAGAVTASISTPSIAVDGNLTASWTSSTTNGFQVASLQAASATVTDANGNPVGSGAIAFNGARTPLQATGTLGFSVTGSGSFTAYAPAAASLGISANWASYSASLSGAAALEITTDSLKLNGTTLPAGTYVIHASSATLAGNGGSTTPNFLGSLSVQASSASVQVEPGSGSATVAGVSQATANGIALGGFTGTLGLTPGGADDTVSLSGTASQLLSVTTSVPSVSLDENSTATFAALVHSSFADRFTLTATAPPGWTATSDAAGNITLVPASGLQGGSYSVTVVAQSDSNPALVAQATILVTINPTSPGLTFSVSHDAFYTVPFNGAQLPTAFDAAMQNTGPAADTYTLTFANLPTGFTLFNSGTAVTVPAGEIGNLGLYLEPNPSQPIPAPGTVLSFDVTATSVNDPAITQTQSVSFTVPNIDALSETGAPESLNTIPGLGISNTTTITNVGNVPETVALSVNTPNGLTVTNVPGSFTLAVGQSRVIIPSLKPASTVPINTTLTAEFTARYGPVGTPSTLDFSIPVNVAVPGLTAILNGAVEAQALGDTDLAGRLSDLSTALGNLVEDITSELDLSQAVADIDAIDRLISADPFLVPLVKNFTKAEGELEAATTASTLQTAINDLGGSLGNLAQSLTDEVAHGFTLSLDPNTAVALPGAASDFGLIIQNVGNAATTYNLAALSLPGGATSKFLLNNAAATSVTLQPGEVSSGLVLEVTETGSLIPSSFNVRVTASIPSQSEIQLTVPATLTVRSAFVSVTQVTPSLAFTNAGPPVDVAVSILNAVNQEQQAEVSYTLLDPNSLTVFTSPSVPVTLTVQTSLQTVDLGSFSTAGLASGSYSIVVTVTDGNGNPLPGGTGSASVLIGLPLSASLTESPPTAQPGTVTVSNTLSIAGQVSLPDALSLAGQVQTTPSATSVALEANGGQRLAYVAGTHDISIVDVTNPTNPTILGTFGSTQIVNGGVTVVRVVNIGGTDYLVAGSTIVLNSKQLTLFIYSLSDPLNPALVSSTPIPYQVMGDLLISGTTILVPTYGYAFSNLNGSILDLYGTVVSVDISNPAAPRVNGILFNDAAQPPAEAGDTNQIDGAIVNSQYAYIGSSTAKGDQTQTGVGRVLVVDYSNPANLTETELDIPGTVQVLDIAIDGNRALVLGSTGGWRSPQNPAGFTGNLTISVLDITDPAHPVLIGSTLVTNATFPDGVSGVTLSDLPLGNGLFAVSDAMVGGSPAILLVDPTNPANIAVTADVVPAVVNQMTVSGSLLYATSSAGLFVYNIGSLTSIPFSTKVEVPNGTGVSVVVGSFNIPPTTITTGTNFNTLEWDQSLAFGEAAPVFTWQTTVTGLKPGEDRPVTLGGEVDFTDGGTSGTAALAPTGITGVQLVALSPARQTVAPNSPATYTVTLFNASASKLTYNLSVLGVPSNWVTVPTSVQVPANGSTTATLTLTSDSYASRADYSFVVEATAPGNNVGSVQGDLILAGAAPAVDAAAHGVVVTLSPTQASAGQGTPATYSVQVTNTGTATEAYTLSAIGLPAGIAAAFSQPSVLLSPGTSNTQTVTLTLTPQPGSTAATDNFTVQAVSAANPAIAYTAAGSLVVLPGGVQVSLSPASGSGGTTFQFTITNTGAATDTFTLSLGGPAALLATLPATSVTLDPGDSQIVSITTTAPGASIQGPIALTATAKSTTDSTVEASATSNITAPATNGLTAQISPGGVQMLPIPGAADFTILVNNTGNAGDAYTVTIMTTAGPIAATLVGLQGQPTQTIEPLRLSPLSSGSFELDTDLTGAGQGTVSVMVQSQNDPSRQAILTATVNAPQSTPTVLLGANPSMVNAGATVTLIATLEPPVGTGTPTGTVTFFEGTNSLGTSPVIGGVATLPLVTLPVGSHTITATYNGDSNFTTADSNSAPVSVITAASPITPTVLLAADQATVDVGTTVTLTATVQHLAGSATPTGTVTFLEGSTTLGTSPVIGGEATLPISTLAVGLHTIEATYNGDINFTTADSNSIPEAVTTGHTGHDQIYAIGAGPGGGPRVQIFDANTDQKRFDIFAYDSSLRGGVTVATGDVNDDGIEDVITGAGLGGGPQIQVFDGETVRPIASWFAYDPNFRGGVSVAAADLDGDGSFEVVTGPGPGGGPILDVWKVTATGVVLQSSLVAFDPSFRGGITVAVGTEADGTPYFTVGQGPGGASQVRVFNARTLAMISEFLPFGSNFTGGAYLAAGDVLGTGSGTQIVVGSGLGGGPRLEVFDQAGTLLANTFAAVDTLRNGLTVGVNDREFATDRVLVGAGHGAYIGSLIGGTLTDLEPVSFFSDFNGGVFVG